MGKWTMRVGARARCWLPLRACGIGGVSRRLTTPSLVVISRLRASFRNASGACSFRRAQRPEGAGAVVVDFPRASNHGRD